MEIKDIIPISLIGFFSMLSFIIQGQSIERQVISLGGGSTTNSGKYTSFTIGESIIGTISNDVKVLTQGFQQNEINESNAIKSLAGLDIILYPNPANSKLFIKGYEEARLEDIYIIDEIGRIIHHSNKYDPLKGLVVGHLNTGQYFLIVKSRNSLYGNGFMKN